MEEPIHCGAQRGFQVGASAGEFLDFVVDQQGVDLVIALHGPDGRELASRNHPNGTHGLETLSHVTREAGRYTLMLRCESAEGAGRFVAELREKATANERHRRIARADELIAEGSALRDLDQSAAAVTRALGLFEEALVLSRESADAYREAQAMRGMGLCLFRQGKPAEALPFFRDSIPRLERLGEERDRARSLTGVGWALAALGRGDEAIEVLERALAIRLALEDRVGVGVVLNNLANVYLELGESETALGLFERSLAVRRELGSKDGEALVLTNMGQVFLSLGDSERATATLAEASVLWDQIGEAFGRAVVRNNLGRAHHIAGRYGEAVDAYKSSLALMEGTGNQRELATTQANLGVAYSRLGRAAQALDLFQEAERIFVQIGDTPNLAGLLTNRGLTRVREGLGQQARHDLERALGLWRQSGRPLGEATALFGLARAQRQGGDLDGALEAMERSVRTLESLRAKVVSPGLRETLFVSKREFFDFYVELLLEKASGEDSGAAAAAALAASELARSRSLRDFLLLQEESSRRDEGSSLASRERALRLRIRARDRRRLELQAAGAPAPEIAEVEAAIETLLGEYDALLTAARQENRRLADLYATPELDLQEIQRRLPPATLVLEYALAPETSVLWTVSSSSLRFYRLPGEAAIEAAVKELHRLVREHGGEATARVAIELAARRLGRLILAPAAAEIEASERLIIVADGALHLVPFSALPVAAGETQGGRLLVETHESVNLPSLSLLAAGGGGPPSLPAGRVAAVFADPVFTAEDPRMRGVSAAKAPSGTPSRALRAARDVGLASFPRLPATRLEAQAIERLVAADDRSIALDFEASRNRVLSELLANYRIVHLATHGVLNARHPELTGLVFSLVDEHGEEQDGFLQAIDLFDLRLDAELVVLSACQTALGEQLPGEGIVGLTRGFFVAGGRGVLATLWSIDDPATAHLMESFYRGLLKQNLGPPAALRRAQLQMLQRRRYASIFYWAPFVLQVQHLPDAWTGRGEG